MLLSSAIKPTRPGRRERQSPAYPIFSDEDRDLAELNWYLKPNGYAARTANYKEDGKWKNRTVHAHRVVLERMLGRELSRLDFADHFNRNKIDCRRSNIIHATPQMNNQNRGIAKNNTSGFKGVVFYRDHNAWVGRVKIAEKWHCTKGFDNPSDANNALMVLRKKLGIHDYDLVRNSGK